MYKWLGSKAAWRTDFAHLRSRSNGLGFERLGNGGGRQGLEGRGLTPPPAARTLDLSTVFFFKPRVWRSRSDDMGFGRGSDSEL